MKIIKYLLLFVFASLSNASLLDTVITLPKPSRSGSPELNPIAISRFGIAFNYTLALTPSCPSHTYGIIDVTKPLNSNVRFFIWHKTSACTEINQSTEEFFYGKDQFELKDSSGKTIYMQVTAIQNDSLKFHATFSFYEKPLGISPKKKIRVNAIRNAKDDVLNYDIQGRSFLNSTQRNYFQKKLFHK